jgi:hypothetical protein
VVESVTSSPLAPAPASSGRQPSGQGAAASESSGRGAAQGPAAAPHNGVASTIAAGLPSGGAAPMALMRADALLQAADAAFVRIGLLASAMQALAAEALNPDLTATQRGVLNILFQQIKQQIRGIVENARSDGVRLLAGGGQGAPLSIAVPMAGSSQTITIASALLAELAPRLGGAGIETRPGAEAAREALSPRAGIVPPPGGDRDYWLYDDEESGDADDSPDALMDMFLIAEAALTEIGRLLDGMAEMAGEASKDGNAGLNALFGESLRRIEDIAAHVVYAGAPLLDGHAHPAIPSAAPEDLAPGLARARLTTGEQARSAAALVATARATVTERLRGLADGIVALRRFGRQDGAGEIAARRAAIAEQRAMLARESGALPPELSREQAIEAKKTVDRLASLPGSATAGTVSEAQAGRLQALLKQGREGG